MTKMVEMPLSDVNDLDDVVRELGIQESHVTPIEAVRELKEEITRWQDVCRRAGICMSCALGTCEPCTDCLGTGWDGGAPAGYVRG